MFAKRPQRIEVAAGAPGTLMERLRGFGAGGALPGPLANPLVGVAGAGLLFAGAAVALVMVTGDPGAGLPLVRISLRQPVPSLPQAPAATAPVDPATGQAVITLQDAAGGRQPLLSAPVAGLSAPGPGGLLPVIGADGRTPAEVYARPFRDTGGPKVALVIGGLGLNATATRNAIEQLPPEVTLSFVPYAEGLQGWMDLARANGHEVLLETPMEPVDYPQNDPGPYTLMAQDPAPETIKRLEWLLSRATGYFGVTNYLGGRFMASDPAMTVFAGALRQRGLAFVDDGSAAARGGGLPRASADRIIDETLDGGSIDEELARLEATALQRGKALGSGFAYPITLQQVQHWAASLAGRGITLAPASAVTARR